MRNRLLNSKSLRSVVAGVFWIAITGGHALAQPSNYYLNAEFTGWSGVTMTNNTPVSGQVQATVQATSANDEFVVDWDSGYNKWYNSSASLNQEVTLSHVANAGSQPNSFLGTSTTSNRYYTLNIKSLGYSNQQAVWMETSNAPVGFDGTTPVALQDANVWPGVAATVDITLSGAKSAEEKVYLRYSTDGGSNWSIVEASFGTTASSGTATIPALAAGTTVNYYCFTSTVASSDITDPDLCTLKLANNAGSNYAFTVESSHTSVASGTHNWSSSSAWTSGSVPPSNVPVTISANVTLDADQTVSDLIIASAGTLNASDGSNARTLTVTGNVTNSSGSFNASDGKVVFNGGNVIAGTLTFNDVSVSGGVNFGSNSTISGVYEILSGGYVDTNAPALSSGSTLKYNNGGTYAVGTEWSAPHHVVIASGAELDFNTSGALSCGGNITVDAGGHLNMDAMTGALTVGGNVTINGTLSMSTAIGGDLEVGGDFELAAGGTFEENDRALTFNGTGAQAINGTTNLVLKYAIVNKASGTLTLNTPLEIEAGGILWPTSGAIDLNGQGLTMHSDATGTAAIGAVGTGITGDITFERYVPDNTNDAASFVNLSSYVSGINATNWTGAGAAWVFEYDETNTGGLNDGWVETSGTLAHTGKGYMAEFPGNASVTLSYTGALTSGTQGVTITSTSSGTADNDAWNLVGNPYPAPVTFGNLAWTAAEGVTKPSGFYIYDGDNGDYTTLTSSDVIGVGQSFWVQAASGGGTLTFEEEDKTTDSSPFIRSTSDPEFFALRVEDPTGKWSRGIVGLLEGTTVDFDVEYDLRTFGDPTEEEHLKVWFQTDADEHLAIQTVSPTATDLVPIRIQALHGGTHMFTLDAQYGTPESLCLVLYDAWTGEGHMLLEDTAIELDLDEGVVYEDRFAIGWSVQPVLSVAATWCSGGTIDLGWTPDEASGWEITWSGPSAGVVENEGHITGLAAGAYEISWVQTNGLCPGSSNVEIEEACVGDYNQNDNRGVEDLLSLLAHLTSDLEEDELLLFDCDCDAQMSIGDLLIFLTVFGTSCN